MLEIEKRYLCNAKELIKFLKRNSISYIILNLEQFYLIAKPGETLRYRKEDNKYIKNQKFGNGLIKKEKEKEVTKKEYLKAKAKNKNGVIKKDRYKFIIDSTLYELDVFKSKLEGLSILEVEFNDVEVAKSFKIPKVLEPYIIKDITNESIYSNATLSRSMKIPLRSDSILSLNELRRDNRRLLKPKLDLYISDYENSKDALINTINRLLLSIDLNLEYFFKYNNIKNLKRANSALAKIKALIYGHQKYIKQGSYKEILFNINNIMLLFEEPLQLQIALETLLKQKSKVSLKKQNKILKEVILLAQKEKLKREDIKSKETKDLINLLKKSINNIKLRNIQKPFNYIKAPVIKKMAKDVKKITKCNSINLVFSSMKNYKIVSKYFLEPFRLKKEYKKLKKEYKKSVCSTKSKLCKYKSKNHNKIIKRLKKVI